MSTPRSLSLLREGLRGRWRTAVGRRYGVASLIVGLMVVSGCADFADPVIPNVRSPALLQLNVRTFDAGVLQVDGALLPGRDSTGFQRVVLSPFVDVNGVVVVPRTLGDRGQRTYNTSVTTPPNATGGPFVITPPEIRDVASLPVARWYGLIRLDPDTLRVPAGQDIVLRLDTVPAMSQPTPASRQWFLDIRSGFRVFRLSSDGPPPMTLRIPPSFIPAGGGGPLSISLIYFQSAQLGSGTPDYQASLTLDTRINWVVLYGSAP